MKNPLKNAPFDALPRPFAISPSPGGVQIKPEVKRLVESQVHALLTSSPNYHGLSPAQQKQMSDDLVKIASYSAALVQDDWAISKKLGQTPLLREQTIVAPLAQALGQDSTPLARSTADEPPPAEEFNPRAASQVARITRDTLNAVAFPTFVADLIKGTFQAIVNASIQQMEAYGQLLANNSPGRFSTIWSMSRRAIIAASNAPTWAFYFPIATCRKPPRVWRRSLF